MAVFHPAAAIVFNMPDMTNLPTDAAHILTCLDNTAPVGHACVDVIDRQLIGTQPMAMAATTLAG